MPRTALHCTRLPNLSHTTRSRTFPPPFLWTRSHRHLCHIHPVLFAGFSPGVEGWPEEFLRAGAPLPRATSYSVVCRLIELPSWAIPGSAIGHDDVLPACCYCN